MSANNGGHSRDDANGDITAAEYVLRLLPEEEQTRLRALAETDPEFQAEIVKWEARLAELAEELEPAAPPKSVLSAIQREIGSDLKLKIHASQTPHATLWNRAPFWRGVSFASLAAFVMAVLLALPIETEKPITPGKLIATLNLTDGSAAFVAAYDPGRKQMILVPASMLSERKLVPELWLIPEGGKPISLGVIDASKPQSMIMPDRLAAHTTAEASMIITLEPLGGAPGGVATGPVIARGKFSQI